MSTNPLGRLKRVSLRDVWKSEAGDFTPWLATVENLSILGEAIGIELEHEATEKDVGPFRADILCKDVSNDHWVLVENQLAKTDHTHLGQLMTYAAGLQAVSIVWIAEKFTEEHRAALDWMNEITDDRFNFFGLEVELWQIGDSAIAPKFNVISKPNGWSKTISEAATAIGRVLTPRKQTQLDFWTAFADYARTHAQRFKPTKPLPQHWLSFALGRSGFHLAAVASFWDSMAESYDGHEVRAELVLDGPNSKADFKALERDRVSIETDLQMSLTWHNPIDARMSRIYARHEADLDDKTQWPEYCQWLTTTLDAFHKVFAPRVKTIDSTANMSGLA